MKLFLFLFSLCTLLGCRHNTAVNKYNEDSIKSWIQNVKSKDLSVFRSYIIEPRYGYYRKDLRYTSIEFLQKGQESIILPVSKNGITGTLKKRFKTEIDRLAKLNRVPQDSALNFATSFVDSIMERFYTLNALAAEGYPDLGEFVSFRIYPDCEIIYCPDTTKVNYTYWRNFFRNTKEIEKGWYRKL